MRWVLIVTLLESVVFLSVSCNTKYTVTALPPFPTPTLSPTPTFTATPPAGAFTQTPTPTNTCTPTVTPTPTNTYTQTLVPTRNANHTPFPGATSTPTPTITVTQPAWTPTLSPTAFPTASWSLSVSFGQQGTDGINGDFQDPMGIAVGAGFIAVSDQPASAIGNVQVFSDNGQYLYNIPANQPWGLALDSYGELYVADLGTFQVTGYYLSMTGYTQDYTWTGQGSVAGPICVKIDANGNLVVGDYYGAKVVNLSWDNDSVLNQSSGSVTVWPLDLALDPGGNIYVTDYNSHGILDFNSNYVYQSGFTGSTWASPASQLGVPWSVGVDSQGNLFISDNADSRVVYATPQGNYLGQLDGFCSPVYLTLDSSDDLYVVDNAYCYRVDEFKK